MSDQNISERLEDILRRVIEYSFELGKWGKVFWINLEIEKDGRGYDGRGIVVRPSKMYEFMYGRNCESRSCVEDIYYSRYRGYDSYRIAFIKYVGEDIDKIKYMARDIESKAYDLYNEIRNSYLDPKRDHLVSVYFRRDALSYKKITKEIEKGIIFEKPPALKKIGSKDQSAFIRSALVEKKSNKYNNREENKNELDFPNSFKFSYMIY
ncbi:MAG: hypothetical protein RXO36_06805 [Candidatus Nanopusillus acidilobi]|jgi:hypothetical protein